MGFTLLNVILKGQVNGLYAAPTQTRTKMSESNAVLSVANADLPPSVGERNSAAKLTESKVRAIRIAASAGGHLGALAVAFSVSPRTVRHIVRGTSWTHIR